MSSGNFFKHVPTLLLGLAVAAILLVAVFSFQLNQTETAVVTTFGRPAQVTEPGLHFRWPFPFQRISRFDKRVRSFEGGAGKLEETTTSDGHNILVGIYVDFQIGDVVTFFRTFENITRAEDDLNSWMRSAKKTAIGKYNFSQLVNTDPAKMCLVEIQDQILAELRSKSSGYGLEILRVGINTINVPQDVSAKVFERMIAERKLIADRYLAEGDAEAKKIRIAADRERTIRLADAEAKAKEIRAEGDAEAARSYAVFQQNPELAKFLRKLDSLRQIVPGRTTLVLDTDTAPFDILKSGAEQLSPVQK
jgi:membrane protease subunit HflC